MYQRTLDNFLIELAVGGLDKVANPMAEQEFDFELSMRPHIQRKNLFWDKSGNVLIVQVEVEGVNIDSAAKQMEEEVFEVANAILQSVNGLNVKAVKVKRVGKVE
jgi:hypothetical protein